LTADRKNGVRCPANRAGLMLTGACNSGITLVELMIVMSIVAILAVALGIEYSGWMGRYKVEKTIKDMHGDLMSARLKAMQMNRVFFFDVSPNGKYYRVSQDDSDGAAKPIEGNRSFQAQSAWNLIQASNPLNWGLSTALTTDTTVTENSRKSELTDNVATLAGLISARGVAPNSGNSFVIGMDNRGVLMDMRGLPLPVTNMNNALAFPASYGLSICIFTDYDNNGTSDYDPDYDCINIRQSRLVLGKLLKQNTDATVPAGQACQDAYNATTNTLNNYGCLSK
jgi:prepilin-type N-terminal cleavage/methylation domain-containing protein